MHGSSKRHRDIVNDVPRPGDFQGRRLGSENPSHGRSIWSASRRSESPRLLNPPQRADGLPPAATSAAPDAATPTPTDHPLTRRALREAAAREAAAAAATEPATPALSAPLTRREARALAEQAALAEQRLRDVELADLEIAPVDSAPLEPALHLHLEASHDVVPLTDPATTTDTEAVVRAPRDEAFARDLDAALARATGPIALAPAATGAPEVPAAPPGELLALPAAATSPTRGRRAPRAAVARAGWRGSVEPRGRLRRGGQWARTGISALAMAFVLGITAVVALPTTVSASPDDAGLVNLSLSAGAATQQLVTASTGATELVDRDGYSVTDAGELQAAGYSTAQLLVGRSLAQELVDAMDSGKLVGSVPDHLKEIRWIAQGVTVPDCGVDYRVLEIIAIAVRNFDQVGVSDINRKCTGQLEGAGTSSSHYIDGGGHAVDFYLLDNKSLNGSDAGTLKMISLLDPVMPVGSRVGQASCRASAGVTVNLTNWTEFDDSCTHMHVDVPVADAPLLLDQSALSATK